MDLKRFFTFNEIKDNVVVIDGDEFFHATKVSRLKKGFKFIACNNTDKDYYCIIKDIRKEYLIAEIESIETNPTFENIDITLCIGICKNLDGVIQKAVEMGVNRIIPFISQHTNIANINFPRINKIILESSKQCGRSKLLEINEIISFDKAIQEAGQCKNKIIFYEFERENFIKGKLLKDEKDLYLFIGSEGGFCEKEIMKSKENGYKICSLGKRILRVETAVVASLTLCHQEMNNL